MEVQVHSQLVINVCPTWAKPVKTNQSQLFDHQSKETNASKMTKRATVTIPLRVAVAQQQLADMSRRLTFRP